MKLNPRAAFGKPHCSHGPNILKDEQDNLVTTLACVHESMLNP
jgi:hypothetical protein